MISSATDTRPTRYYKGIGFMLISALSLSVGALFGKIVVTDLSLPILVFIRFCMPLIILIWLYTINSGLPLTTTNWKLHFVRSVFAMLIQYCFLYYVIAGSLLNATVLLSTGPLFTTILSAVFLKTKLKRKVWPAVIISFTGMLLVLKPTDGIVALPALIGLGSGFFNACSQLTLHKTAKQQEPINITLLVYFFGTLISGVLMLCLWHPLHLSSHLTRLGDTSMWLIIVILGLTSVTTQIFRAKAYSFVYKAASLAPFFYSIIIFSAILEWLVFHQIPDLLSIIGAALIILSGSIMAFWR